MAEIRRERIIPHPPPDPPVELVAVLENYAEVLGYRLICRRTFDEGPGDYHLAITETVARRLNRLFDDKPFRHLRRKKQERIAISYLGIADPHTGEVYLLLQSGRSRLKYRLRFPQHIMWELQWVADLDGHDQEFMRAVVEA